MSVQLKRAVSDDVNFLDSIERLTFDSCKYETISKRQFQYLLSKSNGEIWLARENNKPCGYFSLLYRKNCDFARLYSIAVLQEHQGQGIGIALFEQAEKVTHDKKMRGMMLEIREDNLKSLSRYQHLGYQVTEKVRRYYPDGAACIKMKKVLQ
ncbi:MAG: GNAT family N-acetyltransferase [Alphaproteobacteria bacterium]|nr:GNAT family N-acetyltransferase [Alphaproteobacteria bacterium]